MILDIGDADIVLTPITSKERKGKGDYKLRDWEDSGLLLRSRIRLSKVASLDKGDIERRLGHISRYDKEKISSLWKKLYKF